LPAVGIFVVRAWYEDGQFRARIVRLVDVRKEPAIQIATADPGELAPHLDSWLDELARHYRGSSKQQQPGSNDDESL
jgi:hypothetical protein